MKEVKIPVGNQFLVFPNAESSPDGVDYVKVEDAEGNEVVYYDSQEWADDPKVVMGALLGALTEGVQNG